MEFCTGGRPKTVVLGALGLAFTACMVTHFNTKDVGGVGYNASDTREEVTYLSSGSDDDVRV